MLGVSRVTRVMPDSALTSILTVVSERVNNKSSATAEDGRPYESSYDFVYIGVA